MGSSEETNFNKIVQQYVINNQPHVCILTPCYNSQCYVNYIYCLLNTKQLFDSYNIKLKIDFCKNDSLITRARNNLLAKAMSDSSITHIMFIDNDITWDPINIIKLLISEKPIIGGAYPLKKYNWDNLNTQQLNNWMLRKENSEMNNFIDNKNYIQHNLLQYNTHFCKGNNAITNNMIEVENVATGFMMIKRDVIENMQKEYSSTKYREDEHFLNNNENNFSYALFDCGVIDGKYLSEDWLFCHRWKKMGGSLWIDISINLIHTGIEDFQGSLLSSLL